MEEYFIDGFLGGIILGFISYLSFIFKKSDDFYKILGFVWAVPLTFFFLLYIVSKAGKNAMENFTKHSLLGTCLLVLLSLITLRIINQKKNIIILISFLFAIISTLLYFLLQIYKY